MNETTQLGDSVVKNPPVNAVDKGSIPGSGRSLRGGNGNPLQHSCLGNPMDREARRAIQSTESQRVGHDLATTNKQQPKPEAQLPRRASVNPGAASSSALPLVSPELDSFWDEPAAGALGRGESAGLNSLSFHVSPVWPRASGSWGFISSVQSLSRV